MEMLEDGIAWVEFWSCTFSAVCASPSEDGCGVLSVMWLMRCGVEENFSLA